MKIISYDENYLDEFIRLMMNYLKEEHDEDAKYEGTKHHLIANGKLNFEDFSYIMINPKTKESIGGIFAGEWPVPEGTYIYVNFLIVKKDYRKKGFAKKLVKYLYENVNQKDYLGIAMDVYRHKNYPTQWYKSIGIKDTGWTIFAGDMDSIEI